MKELEVSRKNLDKIRRSTNEFLEKAGVKDLRVDIWEKIGLSLVMGDDEVKKYLDEEEKKKERAKPLQRKTRKKTAQAVVPLREPSAFLADILHNRAE